MAISKRCLGVDVGTNSIKVAELIKEKDRVRINRLLKAELDITPGSPQSEYQDKVATALRKLLKENKVATKDAVFGVSGQYVFIRRLRLPKTTEDRLQRIILYEARNQIPFPLEMTSLEYQIFPEEERPEVEVIMGAVKRDFLQGYMNLVARTGLRPLSINISSLALYNYFNFDLPPYYVVEEKKKGKLGLSLPKLKKKKEKEEKKEEPEAEITEEKIEEPPVMEVRAYVNIGASTFDLAIGSYGEQSRFGFARTVPRAGVEISEAIMESCGISDFHEAEEVKRNSVVILTGEEELLESGEAINKEASEAATGVMERIAADIRRSFDFYISQPDGMAVDTVYVSGGESKLPKLINFMEDRLGLPVQTVENTTNPSFVMGDANGKDISSFVIALGLAVDGLGLAKVKLDFLPDELKAIRAVKEKKALIFGMVGVLAGMVLVAGLAGNNYIVRYNEQRERNLDTYDQLLPIEERIQEAEGKRKEIANMVEAIAESISVENRAYWLDFMVVLQKLKPDDIWIELLIMDAWGNVKVKGKSESYNSIGMFTNNLKELAATAELKDLRELRDEKMKKNVYDFEIYLKKEDKESKWQPKPQLEEEQTTIRRAGPRGVRPPRGEMPPPAYF